MYINLYLNVGPSWKNDFACICIDSHLYLPCKSMQNQCKRLSIYYVNRFLSECPTFLQNFQNKSCRMTKFLDVLKRGDGACQFKYRFIYTNYASK